MKFYPDILEAFTHLKPKSEEEMSQALKQMCSSENKGDVNLNSFKQLPEGTTFSNGGYVDLSSFEQLPNGTSFSNRGDVYLNLLKQLPEGTTFSNWGYIDLDSLKQLPEGTSFFNGAGIYLRTLEQLSNGIIFSNKGNVYLNSLKQLPEGTTFSNEGYVDLSSLEQLPKNFVYTGTDYVYIRNNKIKGPIGVRTDEGFTHLKPKTSKEVEQNILKMSPYRIADMLDVNIRFCKVHVSDNLSEISIEYDWDVAPYSYRHEPDMEWTDDIDGIIEATVVLDLDLSNDNLRYKIIAHNDSYGEWVYRNDGERTQKIEGNNIAVKILYLKENLYNILVQFQRDFNIDILEHLHQKITIGGENEMFDDEKYYPELEEAFTHLKPKSEEEIDKALEDTNLTSNRLLQKAIELGSTKYIKIAFEQGAITTGDNYNFILPILFSQKADNVIDFLIEKKIYPISKLISDSIWYSKDYMKWVKKLIPLLPPDLKGKQKSWYSADDSLRIAAQYAIEKNYPDVVEILLKEELTSETILMEFMIDRAKYIVKNKGDYQILNNLKPYKKLIEVLTKNYNPKDLEKAYRKTGNKETNYDSHKRNLRLIILMMKSAEIDKEKIKPFENLMIAKGPSYVGNLIEILSKYDKNTHVVLNYDPKESWMGHSQDYEQIIDVKIIKSETGDFINIITSENKFSHND